jgi:uncharacterized protein (TIGR00290 family)
MKKKITISWSGGKDSAFALYKILLSGEYEINHLHTVINSETKRVGLHGVREELIEQQANALGFKLIKLYLQSSDNHAAYEALMKSFYAKCAADNIEGVVFGDIFLEDLKKYREELLSESGMHGIYPIWRCNSRMLVEDFLYAGFKTVVCSANGKYFQSHQVGKTIDKLFVDTLHPDVDPCGENGEFHTLVYEGPIFKTPIKFQLGEVVEKVYAYNIKKEDGEVQSTQSSFWFQDLLL